MSPRIPVPLLLLTACCTPFADTGQDTALPDDTPPDGSWDVLVVGAGPGGLAAALEARDRGATVRVIEREAHSGGALWYAGSILLFSGTEEQAAAGVEDSPEILLSEWEGFTGGDPGDPWVQAFATRNVPDVHDWILEKSGETIVFSGLEDASSGPTSRIHETQGRGMDLTDGLEASLGQEAILFSTTVDGFVSDPDGAVIGVTWHRTDDAGVRGWSAAGRTILATGGFQRDLDRVRAFRPDLEGVDLLYACTPGTDGNGHALLESLGARWANGRAIGLYLHGTPDPRSCGEEVFLRYLTAGIWVDPDGRRFMDESTVNGLSTADRALEAVGPVVWLVVDGSLVQASAFMDLMVLEGETGTYTVEEMLAGGYVVSSETVAGLAGAIGADPAILQASVDGFNAWVRDEAEDEWREDRVGVRPIESPPFYATRLMPSTTKAFGGIAVDTGGRVTDAGGAPLPGVLAAGELTGMAGGSLVGHTGFSGSLSAVLLSGRIAGATAAEEALGRRCRPADPPDHHPCVMR
ncbi:MAG: FAD-binding protein [Deltaproteobacteria bacterium]|nr:FAD-binding protein [Deltaproteobacteria bacterium]